LVFAALSLAATRSFAAEDFDVDKAIVTAKTPADHEAIAAYYEKEAAEAQAKVGRVGHRRGTGGRRGIAVTGPSSGLRRASIRSRGPFPASSSIIYHPGQRDFPSPVGNEGISP
jgi:hypothetical protein